MHEFSKEVEELAQEVLEYSLARLKMIHLLMVPAPKKIFLAKLETPSPQRD